MKIIFESQHYHGNSSLQRSKKTPNTYCTEAKVATDAAIPLHLVTSRENNTNSNSYLYCTRKSHHHSCINWCFTGIYQYLRTMDTIIARHFDKLNSTRVEFKPANFHQYFSYRIGDRLKIVRN